jgi:hypothetical protein
MNRVTFSLAWLVFFVGYLFTLPRNSGALPASLALLMLGITIYALIILGKRFPWFGYFLIVLISSLLSGGRRRRW